MNSILKINVFTDPQCPFAYSAEPTRLRLKWLYGDQIRWTDTMIILSGYGGEEATITPEMAAKYQVGIRDKYNMPMNVVVRDRKVESYTACRYLVATQLYFSSKYENLLRSFRLEAMNGGYIDDPDTIDAIIASAKIDATELKKLINKPEVEKKLSEDFELSRQPDVYANAFFHKLSKTSTGVTRYSAPSYQFIKDGIVVAGLPGFWPLEAYEAILGNILPELNRRENPSTVKEVLEWANMPLATTEVSVICQKDLKQVEAELSKVAQKTNFGQDGFWSLK